MTTATTLFSWVLAAAPVPPSNVDATVATAGPVVEADEYTTADGHRTRWASATYHLPDGKFAEVFITADDTASVETSIFVDGEAIVSSSFDERRGVTTWTSSEPGTNEAAAAALAAISERGGDDLFDAFIGDEQAFPCSDYGKKVLKWTKRIWKLTLTAGNVACCASGVGRCIVCTYAVDEFKEYSYGKIDGYCD